ncbi:MAG: hypothetical protein QOJ16_191 [Acidobacteriota bacterium]|nr:hypothetical protein [Acidobacteriota bacterium]
MLDMKIEPGEAASRPPAGEDWRATHLALSAEDLRFREAAELDPELLDRSRFKILDEKQDLVYFHLQSWPTFVGREKLGHMKRVSLAVCNLLRSIPSRIFGNDPQKLNAFYRLGSPLRAELVFSPPNGIESSVCRGDFIDTADGFKCIEFNFTPNLGGWESTILVGLHQQVPATAAFLDSLDVPWSYPPTLCLFFRHVLSVLKENRLAGDGEVNVAFMLEPQELEGESDRHQAHFEEELAKACELEGLQTKPQVFLCFFQELEIRQRNIFFRGTQIHAIVELALGVTTAPVYRAFKTGRVALFNGPIEMALSNKRNVALLSEHESSDLFSPEEREVIRHHIPWSRRIVEGPVRFRGEEVALAELLANEKDRLVLKNATSCGGKGVSLGAFTPAAEWEELIQTAFASGNWVVQERIESLPYLYQSGKSGCSVHDVIWGPFLFGQTYAGMILRMQPKADGGAVNLSLTATEGVLLEVDSP